MYEKLYKGIKRIYRTRSVMSDRLRPSNESVQISPHQSPLAVRKVAEADSQHSRTRDEPGSESQHSIQSPSSGLPSFGTQEYSEIRASQHSVDSDRLRASWQGLAYRLSLAESAESVAAAETNVDGASLHFTRPETTATNRVAFDSQVQVHSDTSVDARAAFDLGLREGVLSTEALERLHGAVNFGYGSMQLALSLLPSKVLKVVEFLGYDTDRNTALKALYTASASRDLRAPLAR